MGMQLCKGEIQSHCSDVLDGSLALVHSALSVRDLIFIKNNVEVLVYNQEQSNILDKIIDDVMYNFTNYYYATKDNYLEHPYLGYYLVAGEEIKDYHENYYDNNPLFKLEYQKVSDTVTKVLFSIRDKEKCLQALDEYCSSYGCDCIYNDEDNILTCEAQNKQLHKLLTENDYNLSNFVVNDIKYIKALCYNECLKKIAINDVTLYFDENNKLVFKCIINASTFVEEYRKVSTAKKVKSNAPKKPRKHFSPSVQQLFNYIRTYAEARAYMIYTSDLIGDKPEKLYENMGALTTTVNRLNKEYREITHDDTITLMKYDKTLECYMITDIWNNKTVI